ncbi:MAG TPA: NfeD family protein [Euzebyales bacterium]|nr:NfeD family protein [Euzebyales bacterium]
MKRWLVGLLAASALLAIAAPALAAPTERGPAPVLVTNLDGPLSPVAATELTDAVEEAQARDAAALVVEINTPGGLVTSMREVVESFLNARTPIITYVTPNGARAASAGTLVTMSGNVAAMAPSTTIGAATPQLLGGGDAGDKVLNDSISYAEAVARQRGRDVAFARSSVETGESVTAQEALERGAIDLIAADRPSLLAELDGATVDTAAGQVRLQLAGAPVEVLETGVVRALLERVVDPNLTFVLLALGTLALLVEFATPGIGAGGITGTILLLLAGFSLSLLPTTTVGLALLALAVGLFIAELFVPGTGVMAAGGSVALVLAGLFLFDEASGLAVSRAVLVPVAGVVLVGSVALAVSVRSAQSQPRRLDDDQLIDALAEVIVAHGDQGQVMLRGERWHVRTDEPPLERGMLVRVLDRSGLTLLVEPEEEWPG